MRKQIITVLLALGLVLGIGKGDIFAAETGLKTASDLIENAQMDYNEAVEETKANKAAVKANTRRIRAVESDFSSAEFIPVNGTINGNITEDMPEKVYQFTLTSAGRVTFDMTSYMRLYCMYVYDSRGEEVWCTDGNEWNENLKFRKDTVSADLTKGNYYLRVTGYYDDWNHHNSSTGSYIFDIKYTSAEESFDEPNDAFDIASQMNLGTTVNGQIADNDRDDIFRFSMSEAGRITLTITSYMQFYCLYVYDSSGNMIWDSDGNEWNQNVKYRKDTYKIDLTKGDYYLHVTGYYDTWNPQTNSTGNYTFVTEYESANVDYEEPNNDFSTAYAIETGTVMKGQIAINDTYDILEFSLGKATDINVHVLSLMKYYLNIYDSAGKEIWYSKGNVRNENTGQQKDTYTVSLSAGTYYLKVTGYDDRDYETTGPYELSISTDVPIGDTAVEPVDSQTYTGKAIEPPVTVSYKGKKLEKGTDYSVTYNQNQSVGQANIVIEGMGSYTGSRTIAFEIVPAPIADAAVTSVANQTYTGKAIKPSVTVTYDGTELKSGADYAITYQDNQTVGVASINIEGKGSYTGTKTVTFQIVPLAISNATVKTVKKRTYTGYAIRPSVTVKYRGRKLINGTDYTVKYKNNKRVGKATVVIKGKGNYTGTKTVSFKIVKKKK